MAEEPSPLLPYTFDPALSEDENFLTWATVQARMSVSKKGHMGTIFVRPPRSDEPHPAWVPPREKAVWDDRWRRVEAGPSRVVIHGNNLPSLYGSPDKMVNEIHAEAACVSRAARRGIALDGVTCYVTFPPCNECFKLLAAAGIKRCVFRKGILLPNGEAVLVAAQVMGIELRATTLSSTLVHLGWAVDERGVPLDSRVLGETCDVAQRDAYLEAHRTVERATDAEREARARQTWIDAEETTERTRNRVKDWWESYHSKFKKAKDQVLAIHGPGVDRGRQQGQKKGQDSSRLAEEGVLAEGERTIGAGNEETRSAKKRKRDKVKEKDLSDGCNTTSRLDVNGTPSVQAADMCTLDGVTASLVSMTDDKSHSSDALPLKDNGLSSPTATLDTAPP